MVADALAPSRQDISNLDTDYVKSVSPGLTRIPTIYGMSVEDCHKM